MRYGSSVLAVCLSAMAAASAPRTARACGGTFCDNPGANQPPMPVDQIGENVLFALGDGYVEAHVQIQYSGDPERFAWVVPVPEVPDLYVGSQLLFVSLLNNTVPTYAVRNSSSGCDSSSGGGSARASSGGSPGGGCGMGGPIAGGSGITLDGTGEDSWNEERAVVEARDSVGSFDVTVLQSADGVAVSQWLEDNGFLGDGEGERIIDEYAEAGFHFVAVKLTPGAGVDEIHPLVIRYPGSEPCIPLKLTRIAAKEDMGVRAFFVTQERVVPTGTFRHITLNDAQIDWLSFGSNYNEVVSAAVDDVAAVGRGFVTEYAGTANVVSLAGVYSASWNAEAFEPLAWTQVTGELQLQGLLACNAGSCQVSHPLLPAMLRSHLPAPVGVTEADFYECPQCYADQFDAAVWSGAAFAADFRELIVDPAERALDIFNGAPRLTRLFTTISPHEMTEDPIFAEVDDSPEAIIGMRTVSVNRTCGNNRIALLPDGREVALRRGDGNTWPIIDDMPAAVRIEQYDEDGKLVGTVDHSRDVDRAIFEHNLQTDPDALEKLGVLHRDDGCTFRSTARERTAAPMPWLLSALALGLWLRRRRHGAG